MLSIKIESIINDKKKIMFNLNFKAMKSKNLFLVCSFLITTALIFTSCKKDENNNDDNNPLIAYSQDDDEANSFFDEVISEVDEVTLTADSKADGNLSITETGSKGSRERHTFRKGNTRYDTIIFNNFVNSKSKFKRTKNGMICIEKIGGPLQDTFVRKISFVNFSINGNSIEGTKTITKVNNYTYTITLQNGKITFNDGKTYTRTFTHTRTWVYGYDTPFDVWDDEYTLEGSAEGVNRYGLKYKHEIKTALHLKATCRYIVSGTVEFTVDNQTITIDYGNDDTCDGVVNTYINGNANQIQLKGDN